MKKRIVPPAILLPVLLAVLLSGCAGAQVRVSPNELRDASTYSEGLVGVRLKDKYGFADKKSLVVIPPQFAAVRHFREGLAAVKVTAKWGFIEKSGRLVIEPRYDNALEFSDGLAAVKIEDRWGYIDRKGQMKIKCQYGDARTFSEGLAAVRVGPVWGYINRKGKTVINPVYQSAGSFVKGLAPVQTEGSGNTYGFIDEKGRIVLKPEYAGAGDFSTDPALAPVIIDGNWGYINLKGKIVINPQFEDARSFAKGLAAVKSNGKWGYITKKGKFRVPARLDRADDFHDDLALVAEPKRAYLMSQKGKMVGQTRTAAGKDGDLLAGDPPKGVVIYGSKPHLIIINFSKEDLKITRNTSERQMPPRVKSWGNYTNHCSGQPDGFIWFAFEGPNKADRDEFRVWFYTDSSTTIANLQCDAGKYIQGDGNFHWGRYVTTRAGWTAHTDMTFQTMVSERKTVSMYATSNSTLVLTVFDTDPGYPVRQHKHDYPIKCRR